ncbi:hypothetical protein [Nocardia sp. NPDC049526]|uniref:hypothetical protein n=1 Tax=Nocardia sp. NPDC049526 TaxID=3364316 RepID=UPI003789FF3A
MRIRESADAQRAHDDELRRRMLYPASYQLRRLSRARYDQAYARRRRDWPPQLRLLEKVGLRFDSALVKLNPVAVGGHGDIAGGAGTVPKQLAANR